MARHDGGIDRNFVGVGVILQLIHQLQHLAFHLRYPFHQLVFRRIVRVVIHEQGEARQLLARNNRTAPYLWIFCALTVLPAVLFWNNTPVLMGFCLLFAISYVVAYLMIIRFKVPRWLRR